LKHLVLLNSKRFIGFRMEGKKHLPFYLTTFLEKTKAESEKSGEFVWK